MTTQRNWMLFLFGVVLSTFVGGGVRVLLSPEVVSRWVNETVQKKQPKFNLTFGSARVSLADGWKPHLAVELTDLKVNAKDKCVTESEVTMDRVLVPVQFGALIQKQIFLGHVRGDKVELTVKESKCSTPSAESLSELESVESFLRRRWNKEVSNTIRFLTEITVDNLRVREGASTEPKFQIYNLEVDFLARENIGRATFEFWPGVDWVGAQPFGATQTALHISSEGMKWTAKGNLKEGQIHLNGSWRVEKSNVVLHAQWTDVPLAPLVALLSRWDMINTKQLVPRNQWSTCQIDARGPVRDWKALKFQATNCRLSGDFGDAQIINNEWALLKGEMTPFTAQLKNLNLKRVAELFDVKAFKNVSNFGVFNGAFAMQDGAEWSLDGQINGAEIYAPIFDGSSRRTLGPVRVAAFFKGGEFKADLKSEDAFNLRLTLESEFVSNRSGAVLNARVFSKPEIQTVGGSLLGFPFENIDFKFNAQYDGHRFYDSKGSVSLSSVEIRPDHPYYAATAAAGLNAIPGDSVRLEKADVSYSFAADVIHANGPIRTAIVGKELRLESAVANGIFNKAYLAVIDKGQTVKRVELEGEIARPVVTE